MGATASATRLRTNTTKMNEDLTARVKTARDLSTLIEQANLVMVQYGRGDPETGKAIQAVLGRDMQELLVSALTCFVELGQHAIRKNMNLSDATKDIMEKE